MDLLVIKLKSIFIALFLLFQLNAIGQSRYEYCLEGMLTGLKDSTFVLLLRNKEDKVDTISRAIAIREKFQFKGRLLKEGEVYFIFVDTLSHQYAQPVNGKIRVVMESRHIKLSGALGDFSDQNIKVTGSQSHKDYVEFMQLQRNMLEPANKALTAFNKAVQQYNESGKLMTDSLLMIQSRDAFKESQKALKNAKIDWILKHRNSLMAPWAIGITVRGEERTHTYRQLTSRAQNSYFGLELKKAIDMEIKLGVGALVPSFNFPTSEGTQLSLQQVVATNKVTLIDFWASWCGPCRAAFPGMKELFAQYKNKGFNIIGYSVDKEDSAWRKALDIEQLPWVNVRETTSFAMKHYGVNKLPTLLVLDSQGRIIAYDPTKSQLMRLIKGALLEQNNVAL